MTQFDEWWGNAEAIEIVNRIKGGAENWGGWSGTVKECDRLLEILAQSAEQDRIDAERWRMIKSMWNWIDTEVVDAAIAKGASK